MESPVRNSESDLFQTLARQARAIALVDGWRGAARVAELATELSNELPRLSPAEKARRVAAIDRMLGIVPFTEGGSQPVRPVWRAAGRTGLLDDQ